MLNKFRDFYLRILLNKAENATPQIYERSENPFNPNMWNRKNKFLKKLGIVLGENVAIDSGFEWVIARNIRIMDYASIGKNFKCYSYNNVVIGKFCMFAGEVQISNGTHEVDSFIPSSGLIEVGNGVWIGHGVRIVGKNISIGENSIIGAGALVLSDVEANSIVVGVPAKKIGVRAPSERVWHLGGVYYSPVTFEVLKETE